MSADTTHALDHWAPRRRLTLAQARKRTQVVKALRFGLVAAATVTVCVFFGYLAGSAYRRAKTANDAPPSQEMVVMQNPRFTGRDANGDVYTITADRAERRRADENLVDLVNPKLTDAYESEISAPRGLFNREDETLELFEDVSVADREGYVFNSEQARVLIATGRVEGVKPLVGTGPIGDVRSDSYELNKDDDSVTFINRVQTVIYPDGRLQRDN